MYRSEYLYRNIDKLIQDSEVFPICVPSYSRPNASLLKYSKVIPIWLFVREEQLELYKEYQGICKIVPLTGVYDIGTTRKAIVDYMWNLGYGDIFMLDDDIYLLSFRYPGFSKSGKELMKLHCDDSGNTSWDVSLAVFKMWVWMIYNSSDKVTISGAGRLFDWWNIRYKDVPFAYNSSTPIQCIHLNISNLKKHGIQYESNAVDGAEDYALQYKIMSKGLYSVLYKDLAYDSARVNKAAGGNQTDDIVEKYTKYVQLFNDNVLNPEDIYRVGTKVSKSGFPSITFKWNHWRIKDKQMVYSVEDIDTDLQNMK